jgi:HAD superfamily hydrolase (TIGR01484 family)
MSSPTTLQTYHAIVFDLDGTAIPNDPHGMPSDRLVRAVTRHKNRFHLIAATGRPLKYALPVITALGLSEPCIISGGAIIYDPVLAKVTQHTTLPPAAVKSVFELAQSHHYGLTLRDENIDLTGTLHHSLLEDTEIIYLHGIPASELASTKRQFESIPHLTANAVPDWNGQGQFVLNITHQDATKEHAVTAVLRQLNIAREHTIGVGDGDNDIHLFAAVGLKIAMGNAGPALLAAADLIAPPIDEDGLAHIIERYA